MRCPDVNILLYAHRRDHRHHEFYRAWIENLVNGREPAIVLPWPDPAGQTLLKN